GGVGVGAALVSLSGGGASAGSRLTVASTGEGPPPLRSMVSSDEAPWSAPVVCCVAADSSAACCSEVNSDSGRTWCVHSLPFHQRSWPGAPSGSAYQPGSIDPPMGDRLRALRP